MSEAYTARTAETAGLEVRVLRHGEVVHQEFCESEEEAVLAVDAWSEFDDVECQIREAFSSRSGPYDPAEPDEPLGADADYDEGYEAEAGEVPAAGPDRGYWE